MSWSYRSQTADSTELKNISGLRAPKHALGSAFGAPMLLQIGQFLDRKALQCANTALNRVLDASSCGIQNDLTYIIYTSYIAAKSALSDFTTYGPEQAELCNTAKDSAGALLPGEADFVIYSNDIAALSIRVIVVIPTIACRLVLLVTILTYKFGSKKAYKKIMGEFWGKSVDSVDAV